MARQLWDKEERTPVTPEAAVSALGYASLSGASRIRLSALKKYGLLQETAQGLQLTPLAVRILHAEERSVDHRVAVREAALTPELFRELAEHQTRASEDSLRRYLLTKMDFTEAGAKQCARSFRDTVEFANLDVPGHNQMETSHTSDTAEDKPAVSTLSTAPSKTAKVLLFSWPLSRDVSAEVRFTGAQVRPLHLERLINYLKLAREAVSDIDSQDMQDDNEET
jgi:hypothetical protein